MNKITTTDIFLNKYWRFLLVIIVIVLFLSGYALILGNDFSNWQNLQSQSLTEVKTKINDSQTELDRLAAVKTAYDKLAVAQQANLSRLSQILPAAADLPQLIVQLEAVARQSGFSLNEVSFGSAQSLSGANDPRLKALTINVVLAGPGDYQNLKHLLTNIEQHIRLLDLLSLSLKSADQIARTNGQTYSLSLLTYYWQP